MDIEILDLLKMMFYIISMVNHYKPPFGRIVFYTLSKNLKQTKI